MRNRLLEVRGERRNEIVVQKKGRLNGLGEHKMKKNSEFTGHETFWQVMNFSHVQ